MYQVSPKYSKANYQRVLIPNEHIKILAWGPQRFIKAYTGYLVKGYWFPRKTHSLSRLSDSSSVCVLGKYFGTKEDVYYGILDEIIEIDYCGVTIKYVVVFNCTLVWHHTRWNYPGPYLTGDHKCEHIGN